MYTVIIARENDIDIHSRHESYKSAVDQADLIHGYVGCGPDGITPDTEAHAHAVLHQEFDGDYLDWQTQPDAERNGYEDGAK